MSNLLEKSPQEMRFIVTGKCNYDCTFCHGETLSEMKKQSNLLTPDDWTFLYQVGSEIFGMKTVTLTGGEPLMRRDILPIAQKLHDSGAYITMVSNGALLPHRPGIGKYIDKINVSLHSLNQEKYASIVQRKDTLPIVKNGVRQLREQNPQATIMMNSACTRGFNDTPQDLASLVEFAKEVKASIKMIELFPATHKDCVPLHEIQALLTVIGFEQTHATKRKINLTNGVVTVALTRILCAQAMLEDDSEFYCKVNNDLFISPEGKIKLCRNAEDEIDILPAIKARDKEFLSDQIRNALHNLGKQCSKVELSTQNH